MSFMIKATANQTRATPAPMSMRTPVSVKAVPFQKRATALEKPFPMTPPKAVMAWPIAVKIALIMLGVSIMDVSSFGYIFVHHAQT